MSGWATPVRVWAIWFSRAMSLEWVWAAVTSWPLTWSGGRPFCCLIWLVRSTIACSSGDIVPIAEDEGVTAGIAADVATTAGAAAPPGDEPGRVTASTLLTRTGILPRLGGWTTAMGSPAIPVIWIVRTLEARNGPTPLTTTARG